MERSRDRGLLARMLVALGAVTLADAALVALAPVLPLVLANEVGNVTDVVMLATADDAVLEFVVETPFRAVVVLACLTAGLVAVEYLYARRRCLRGIDAGDPPPELERRVARLARGIDVPPPAVGVVDASVPNCFTVGRRGNATVVVTEPLLSTLDDDQLDGVLAHELAHVHNRDVTVMVVATAPALLAYRTSKAYPLAWELSLLLAVFVLPVPPLIGSVLHHLFPTLSVLGADVGAVANLLWAAVIATAFVLVASLLAAVPVMVVARLFAYVTAATAGLLSKYREFAADRGGAYLTGDPAALASALVALDGDETASTDDGVGRPDRDLRATGGPADALCFRPGGTGVDTGADLPWGLRYLMVVHPPTEARTDRLSELAAEFETGTGA